MMRADARLPAARKAIATGRRPKLDAIARRLVRLSRSSSRHPEIRELDINPLLADEKGVIALDARVRIAARCATPRRPLAIRPYPVGVGDATC